ncbi:MAG: MoxR family ATPase [Pseudomonadota bacterium]
MAKLYYTGEVDKKALPEAPVVVDTNLKADLDKPDDYLPHPLVVKAVNAALWLGQPLLVTGAPGVGKSSIAASVARELAWGQVKTIHCRADMVSADLFYEFDQLTRLFDVNAAAAMARETPNTGETAPATSAKLPDLSTYLNFHPLGEAILIAAGADAKLKKISSSATEDTLVKHIAPPSVLSAQSPQSVVLIDEIDKAPRDVPNDILNQIDAMSFRIHELGCEIKAPADRRPFVIMTSNSEKSLPEAFLRRCVYVNVPYPSLDRDGTKPTLEDIVVSRLGNVIHARLFAEAFDVFRRIFEQSASFRHRPSPAVFLNWLLVLQAEADGDMDKGLGDLGTSARDLLGVMLNDPEDLKQGQQIMDTWSGRKR